MAHGTPRREAGSHRPLAGVGQERAGLRRSAPARHRLHPEPVPDVGPPPPPPHRRCRFHRSRRLVGGPAMIFVFWALVALIVFAYFGYPAAAAVAGAVLDRRVRKEPVTPRISVVIAAYDEEDDIVARLRNVLASDYPADRIEVVVASDGSTDATVALASSVDAERVRVLDLPRRGKAAALAEGVTHATGEVLVFSDANTMFRPDALSMLARNFADPEVGGVAGRTGYLVAGDAESAGHGESLYWRYDTWLKSLETRTG